LGDSRTTLSPNDVLLSKVPLPTTKINEPSVGSTAGASPFIQMPP
jgi:hypothetical protein